MFQFKKVERVIFFCYLCLKKTDSYNSSTIKMLLSGNFLSINKKSNRFSSEEQKCS